MILSRIIGTTKANDGTITKGKISLYSVFIGSSPAKSIYCIPKSTKTPFEVYNNFLLENAPVNIFNQLKYLAGDTMNSTGTYDSYLLSTTITSAGVSTFDSNTKIKWLDPENKTLYRTKSVAPAPGEWPSPVFIETPRGSIILISEDSSFTKYYEYAVKTHITDIYNLIPSKHYFYRILEGSNIIKTGEFDTKGLIRMIKLNALRNTRDCGGWPTVDGLNRFKYGIIFRGGGLGYYIDDSINTAANRALDLATLENDFGVTGSIDLGGNLAIDPLALGHNISSENENIISIEAVSYYSMPGSYSLFKKFLSHVLKVVSRGDAVYVHCLEGRDRTGSFIATLQALCGVCDDGIVKDYELSTFWGNGTYRYNLLSRGSSSKNMWEGYSSSGTTQERVFTWFKSNYVANSIGDKATAEEALEYIKGVLLEPILQQEEPIPEADDHSVENSLVLNYLNTKSYTASDVTSTTTAGISEETLMGYSRMVDCNKYASYKNENFISSDYITNSKPNPYVIDVTGATSVELSDGNNIYIIANTSGTFTSKIKQNDSVVSATFNDLPVIGPSKYNSTTDTPIKIWNLIPGKQYTYTVKDSNNNILKFGAINATGLVRMLHFEGVLNVRDLGGWPCYDSNGNLVGRVAYDKLYRGGLPDSSTYWNKIGVTNNDARMMTDFVKLGYQIDLRESDTDSSGETAYKGSSSNKCSRFGKDTSTNKIPWERVRIIPYWRGIDYVTGTDESPNTTPIANIFTCLGKIIKNLNGEKSTYFNCSLGADRTGLIAMIIEALIGVNDDSILKDYELTTFSGAMIKYSGAIYEDGSDYRAIHNDCSKYTNYFVELKENLFTYYPASDGNNTIQKCLTNWFILVSKLQAITTAAGNQWLHAKHGSDSGSKKTLSESSTNSYLNLLNSAAGITFASAEEVITFLKNKLINF